MPEDTLQIRLAQNDDWEPAMELAWKTFLKFEAPVYDKEGVDNFLSFISEERLYKMFLAGEYPLYVAVRDGKTVGMLGVRSGNHISLLFVDEKYHRQGIGKKLVLVAAEDIKRRGKDIITVNSSPYGLPFYKKLGFTETDGKKHDDGITYYPMAVKI